MDKQIFRKEAAEDVSANQFQDYIKPSHVNLYVIIAACVLALGGLCLWGFFGDIPVSMPLTAVCRGGELVCYAGIEESDSLQPDSIVLYDGGRYAINEVGRVPRPSEEIRLEIGNDGIFTRLGVPEWATEIRADAPDSMGENTICDIEILVDRKSPVEWLLEK
jgi:hypothetical protein